MKRLLVLALLVSFTARAQIGVIFYGNVPDKMRIYKTLERRVQQVYGKQLHYVTHIRTMPRYAYYPPRQRYLASKLIYSVSKFKGYEKVIAITSEDISDRTPNWGILGSSSSYGCVISSYRARTLGILMDTGIHELGHTYGLKHCSDSSCYMEAYKGIIREHNKFCSTHNKQIKTAL